MEFVCENLVQLLEERAGVHPDRRAFTFLSPGGGPPETLAYGELALRCRSLGRRLARRVRPGDRILLVFPSGLDYIGAFFACLYAGAVAVPAYPPRPHRNLPDQNLIRLRAIVRDARPALVLTTAVLARRMRELAVPELAPLELFAADDSVQADTSPTDAPERQTAYLPGIDGDGIAYLQYTSGSTGDPKGVVVTHGQLLANEEMIRRIAHQTAESVVVGWLPLYHDMGLIGQVLQPIYNGGHCVLFSPMSFLMKPLFWLETMQAFRGTTGIAPNFGYELCTERATPEIARSLDLSTWTKAFIGSEPVRPAVMRDFAESFGLSGFRAGAFYPCYGLAEATLAVSGTRFAPEPTVRNLDPAALENGRVLGARPDATNVLAVVSCGGPAEGVELRIVDPTTGAALGEGQVGEIRVRGPAVALGYWGRPIESGRIFRAPTAPDGAPFLCTGDLGFIDGGELFVTGRVKDMVVLDGRNLYPHDLEQTAEESHALFRPGGSAAFSVQRDRGEELVMALELRREARGVGTQELERAVQGALSVHWGVRPAEIVLVKAGSLPRTSSGKLQRLHARSLYLAGALQGEDLPV